MKLTAILLIAACLTASAKGFTQSVTLSMKNAPLEKVFAEIEKQTNYNFIYSKSDLQGSKSVDVEAKNSTIESVLKICFKDQGLGYTITENYVVVRKKLNEKIIEEPEVIPPIDVHGRVVNEKGEPVVGASVRVKGTDKGTSTNEKGEFVLNNIDANSTLIITAINIETVELKVMGKTDLAVGVKTRVTEGQEVIVANTGYQTLKPNEITGSYSTVGKELIDRSVHSNILRRIENLTPGVLFSKVSGLVAGENLLIRGRNSIFSSVAPLIVVDNFPYDGDPDNINPNDVESVTVLKDAAATSIWGARAGNGVIVITTRKGKTTKPQVEFNTNFSFQPRPDLSRLDLISSLEAIEVEKWLFDKGYYNSIINNLTTKPVLSPVQEILLKKRNGVLSSGDANQLLEKLGQNSVNDDLEKYFLRPTINQRNFLSVNGNSPYVSYYMSMGWDKSISQRVGESNNRITLNTRNTFKITKKFQVEAGIIFTQTIGESGNNEGIGLDGIYPYSDLVDEDGNSLVIDRDFRSSYTDTAGAGKLLDWKYRPFDDISTRENRSKSRDYLIRGGLKYQILRDLNVEFIYQFQNGITSSSDNNKLESYYARNLINRYYQPTASQIKFPIPIGGILDQSFSESLSHQGRIQFTFNKEWKKKHRINALGGWEIKDQTRKGNSNRVYGYNPIGSSFGSNLDYVTRFPLYYNPAIQATIPFSQNIMKSVDRFISSFINAFYSFDNKYVVSASAREDAANLFGVNTNQRGVPLWSAGISWQISNEKLYKIAWLPYLKFRATYGHSGNFSRQVSAFPTASLGGTNSFGDPVANLRNPPNKDLRWEKDITMNLAVDFAFKNKSVEGSVDFYTKRNKDLMAQAPIDPTTGLNTGGSQAMFFGNVAEIKGRGFEVNLTSRNIQKGSLSWQTNFLFSYSLNKVSKYFLPPPTLAKDYINFQGIITPIIGKPIYGFYSYRWFGLDPMNGDPIGYLGNLPSKNWTSIINNTKPDSMLYHGPKQEPFYGAVRNTLSWKRLSISIGLSFKAGYYFRRSSISYGGLFSSGNAHGDFSRRWKQPGDEKITNIPSMIFPDPSNRGNYFFWSEVLVEKGDHIRLDDISINYIIQPKSQNSLIKQLRIYGYTAMDVLLWKANKAGIDPYYTSGRISKPGFSFGLSATF